MHKVLKKTIATLAMLSLVGSAIPMSASAVTYDRCDVNHDGVVNATDSLVIYKYLHGLTSSANYNWLDADQNLIVDMNDYQYVTSLIMGKSYNIGKFYSRKQGKLFSFPAVSENLILSEDPKRNEQRRYVKYTYATGNKSYYSLTPSTESINAQMKSNSFVDGKDNRIVINGVENTGVVRLSSDNHDKSFNVSTGFIVGDHVIATAAHCVYNGNEFRDNMTIFTYGMNGKPTGKKLTAVETHVWEKYLVAKKPYYDYALITVKEDLSDYFQFDLGTPYNVNPTSYTNIPIYVTGRPGETYKYVDGKTITNLNTFENLLYTDEGRVTVSSDSILYFNTDVTEGQSGSPVYTIIRTINGSNFTDTATVLSITSRNGSTSNSGPLITTQHIMFYRNNPNISY